MNFVNSISHVESASQLLRSATVSLEILNLRTAWSWVLQAFASPGDRLFLSHNFVPCFALMSSCVR